jgi:hypothetical protein
MLKSTHMIQRLRLHRADVAFLTTLLGGVQCGETDPFPFPPDWCAALEATAPCTADSCVAVACRGPGSAAEQCHTLYRVNMDSLLAAAALCESRSFAPEEGRCDEPLRVTREAYLDTDWLGSTDRTTCPHDAAVDDLFERPYAHEPEEAMYYVFECLVDTWCPNDATL